MCVTCSSSLSPGFLLTPSLRSVPIRRGRSLRDPPLGRAAAAGGSGAVQPRALHAGAGRARRGRSPPICPQCESRQVGSEVGPTSAFNRCIPTGVRGRTCIFWANLTPFSLAAPRLATPPSRARTATVRHRPARLAARSLEPPTPAEEAAAGTIQAAHRGQASRKHHGSAQRQCEACEALSQGARHCEACSRGRGTP